jgi:hypothetical protein
MGNPWMMFLAEERKKEENKGIHPMKLSSHVRPKYDAWKAAYGQMPDMKKSKTTKKRRKSRRGTSRKR